MENQIYLYRNRIFYYDLLRAFAIFCVVCCHVFAFYVVDNTIFGSTFWYFSIFLNSLRDIGVPLFVILSGCLLIKKNDSFMEFFKKRFSRVIIPYLFWGLIFIIFYSLVHHDYYVFNYNHLIGLFINVFSVNPTGVAGYFWFVPMILMTYILIFVINKINDYCDYFLLISLIISLIIIIMINIGFLPSAYFFPIFSILGYYISNFDFLKINLVKNHFKIFVLLLGLLFIIFYTIEVYINASTSILFGILHAVSPFSFINISVVILIFLFFKYLVEMEWKYNFRSKIEKSIYVVSKFSYGIYLSHMLVLYLINNILSMGVININRFITSILILISTFIASFLLINLLNHIPILNRLSGSS